MDWYFVPIRPTNGRIGCPRLGLMDCASIRTVPDLSRPETLVNEAKQEVGSVKQAETDMKPIRNDLASFQVPKPSKSSKAVAQPKVQYPSRTIGRLDVSYNLVRSNLYSKRHRPRTTSDRLGVCFGHSPLT